MGSTETKEYVVPTYAYENISNNKNKYNEKSVNVGTQHDIPSNLTIKQQQDIDNSRSMQSDNCTSGSTIRERSIGDGTYKEINNFQKSCVNEKCETYNLMKEANSSCQVMTKKLVPDNDDKKTSVTAIRRKKSLKSLIKPPKKLNDLDDFKENWNIWKEQIISFLILIDEEKLMYHQWGNMFLNFMGPFGQEILNKLFFNMEEDKKDYATLLRKYDIFYKFHKTHKSGHKDTVKYIEKLKELVAQDFKNVDITVKYKIAREIEQCCKERFIALAKSKLPKFQFKTTFNSLTLAEIAFLWKNCEEFNFDDNRNCKFCGTFHQTKRCPAFDKECSECKRRGHFSTCCPNLLNIRDCSCCGGNHKYKHCPSYGETCSKCGQLNHFSWKCTKEIVLKNCRNCGNSHLMNRHHCPARQNLCPLCGKYGHYIEKCTKVQDVVQKLEID